MNLPKTFAACVAGAVLAFQLYIALPVGTRGAWYWPIIDYQMYSAAKQRGDRVEVFEFRARPCDGSPAHPITTRDLGITHLRFQDVLENARGGERRSRWDMSQAEARALIARLIEQASPGRYCAGQVWKHSYTVGQDDPAGADVDWHRADGWPFAPESP